MNWKIIRREGKARLGLMAVLAILLALISTVPGLAQTGPNTMNFQGRLLDNSGDPVSGVTRCMRFRMCSDSGCTNQRWPSSGYEYHAVTTESGTYKAGLFTVTLGDSVNYTDYPIEPTLLYDYDTLYLEIGVSDAYGDLCDTRTDYDTMTPRSQLHANAYAQRSRRVRTEENDDAYLITVANSGQGGGIYAQTTNSYPGAIPGYFYALSPSGSTTAVSARNDSTTDTARAGYFYAAGSSGGTYGIWAKNDSASSSAAAGYFEATGGIGVYGESSFGNAGVRGYNNGLGPGVSGASSSGNGVVGYSGSDDGVFGESSSGNGVSGLSYSGPGVAGASTSGYGVAGNSGSGIGVSGYSTSSYGVYGSSSSSYAGYFEATGTSGVTYGVFAENDSSGTGAAAGYFENTATSGRTYGVHSKINSTSNWATAGRFEATGGSGATYGVHALNNSTTDGARAGYFHAAGSSGRTYGIWARNDSSSSAAAAGVFENTATNGTGYTLRATHASTDDEARAALIEATASSGRTRALWVSNASTDPYSVAALLHATGGRIIEGYSSGFDLEFMVDNDGDVYADRAYHCGQSISDAAGDLDESEISPCLVDDTGAADFAEVLPATGDLESGDVLVISSDGRLTLSSEAYQPTVVGVYSTRPSYVGGAANLGENGFAPLAVAGIVPVKASAENGPIVPGDLLVASSMPGHAMRCEEVQLCFGRTIGKALEGLENGTGVISMLVTLQ